MNEGKKGKKERKERTNLDCPTWSKPLIFMLHD
jgi:hypothetical protein